MPLDLLWFALAGILSGTLAGLLGIGGGSIIVPFLAYVFSYMNFPHQSIMHMAMATSLASMIFTSSMSTFSHAQRGTVLWSVFRQLLPGIIIGVIMGVLLAAILSTTGLKIIFGIFLLLVSLKMFFPFKLKKGYSLPSKKVNCLAGFIVGGKSGLLGVGGGAITIPYLSYYQIPLPQASGTSAACGVPIALVGAISTIFTGWQATVTQANTFGYIYWPAALLVAIFSMMFVFVGAKLAKILPVSFVRKLFAVLLCLVALNLLSLYGA